MCASRHLAVRSPAKVQCKTTEKSLSIFSLAFCRLFASDIMEATLLANSSCKCLAGLGSSKLEI